MTSLEKDVVTGAPIFDNDDDTIGCLLLNGMRRAGLTHETLVDGLDSSERSVRDHVAAPNLVMADLDGPGLAVWLAGFDRALIGSAVIRIKKDLPEITTFSPPETLGNPT